MDLASALTIAKRDEAVLQLLRAGWERAGYDSSGYNAIDALSAGERREIRAMVNALLDDLDTFNALGSDCWSELVQLRDLMMEAR